MTGTSIVRMQNTWARKSYAGNLKLAQAQFNMMTRLEASDDEGFCKCVVTGKRIHYKAIDAGHFISANRSSTRFNEMNVHPQSKASNQFDTTNDSLIFYTIWMTEKYGRDAVDELIELSRQTKKWERDEVLELRVGWAKRIKKQEQRLGI